MNKRRVNINESERLDALHKYEILDTQPEEDFDRITKIASLVCGVPISLISLIDEDRQWFKSRVGLDVGQTSRSLAFCQYAIKDRNFMEVPDAQQDERFKNNELVTSDPYIRYYLGFPLVDPDGFALGTLCVIDTIPKDLSSDQKQVLSLLRDEVVSLIINRKEKERYKESEQELKAFFDNSQSLMCTHDLEGNLLKVNNASAAILGYTRAEIEKLSLYDIIPSKGHENLDAYLKQLVKTGTVKGEMRTSTKSGELRIWLFNNILQANGDKKPYVIGNAVDITEQHFLEKDLRETQAMLTRTGRVARIGGWEYNLLEKKLIWSDVTKEIHGVPPTYQPDIAQGLDFYKEGDSRIKISQAIDEAITKGTPWDLELEIFTFKGEDLWVRALGNAEFEDGQCIRLYGTFQDIDKRKRIEAESVKSKKLLEDVLEATSAVGIIATDNEGLITLFNKGAENLLGYSTEEVIGKFTPALFHVEEEIMARANELTIELGREVMGFRVFVEKPELYGAEQREWTYVRKDGHLLYVSLAVTTIRDTEENIIGYLGIATDISKIIHQREELEKAKILAEQGSIAKSEFLANMSHEIRTPLNGIIGFTDLMTRTSLDDTQQEYLSIVDQSATLLLSIINDILDFSKIEAGKLELDIDKCDLYELLTQVTTFLNIQAPGKNVEFHLNISKDVPQYIWVDSLRVKQVLMNLLSNAKKFTEKGKIELCVDFLSKEDDLISLRFSVRDTGIGIKAEKQEKIFDAFSQEDASTTKRYGGTGLGLTISNKLLKMMGSGLKLESTYLVGSRFYFDLSVRYDDGDVREWLNLKTIRAVLIVANDPAKRTLLAQMLNLQKIKVFEAANGFEVLQLLMKGNQYDAIIIDNDLPIMSGVETIKKIKEKLFSIDNDHTIIPIFDANEGNISNICTSLGIRHWLENPVVYNDLYAVLSKIEIQEIEKAGDPGPKDRQHGEGFKILLVEDNEFNTRLETILIRNIMRGIEILEAKDGLQGIAIFREMHPDLVLMDIQMPDMNGYEVTEVIRKEETGIRTPIIALTAGNVLGEKEKCLAAGMDDFVVKPVVEQTLRAVLTKWLHRE
ncbi:PAS domain S-box protein [Sphingobacterium sp. UDSM-2020]|uniref:PAS domain S-box protein n=1 Tax=Sphingobacterium sp. UDSM-2020 TaxID=2795738 RepID=UPI0019371B24|nr:PAS domain S-box protein [Sphingobacterium sp. UDSM-2020]QQD12740.1 PAS domain S-box protein [Sphingobacterium sp. UDSM-2020]